MTERLPDPSDVASAVEEKQRELSIQAHLNRPIETPLKIDGVRVCKSCEEIIPHERLQALPLSVRCVYCQNDFDNLNMHKA